MHENANMAYQAQETQKLLKTIISISPSITTSDGTQKPDDIVMQYCDTLLNPEEGIPNFIKLENIRPEHQNIDERGLKPSLTTVLLQEVERFNLLLEIIQDSLEKLVSAIQGKIVMSADLDGVYKSLLNNQVPTLWANYAYPSLKPLYSWVKNLKARVAFMQSWVEVGIPTEYPLPYFFFPPGFLTGVLQTYSRKNSVAIDKLKFDFRVIDPEKERTEDGLEGGGIFIVGLYLEGARWDKKRRSLADQFTNMMYEKMLPIAFTPVEITDNMPLRDIKKSQRPVPVYECPLYKTVVRAGELSTTGQSTNFILCINLPTLDEKPRVWVLRGTALLCELSD